MSYYYSKYLIAEYSMLVETPEFKKKVNNIKRVDYRLFYPTEKIENTKNLYKTIRSKESQSNLKLDARKPIIIDDINELKSQIIDPDIASSDELKKPIISNNNNINGLIDNKNIEIHNIDIYISILYKSNQIISDNDIDIIINNIDTNDKLNKLNYYLTKCLVLYNGAGNPLSIPEYYKTFIAQLKYIVVLVFCIKNDLTVSIIKNSSYLNFTEIKISDKSEISDKSKQKQSELNKIMVLLFNNNFLLAKLLYSHDEDRIDNIGTNIWNTYTVSNKTYYPSYTALYDFYGFIEYIGEMEYGTYTSTSQLSLPSYFYGDNQPDRYERYSILDALCILGKYGNIGPLSNTDIPQIVSNFSPTSVGPNTPSYYYNLITHLLNILKLP